MIVISDKTHAAMCNKCFDGLSTDWGIESVMFCCHIYPHRVSTKDAADKYEYSYTPCQPVVCGDSGGAASVVRQSNSAL